MKSRVLRVLFFGDGRWAERTLRLVVKTEHPVLGLVARTAPSDPALLASADDLGVPVFQPRNVNAPEFAEIVRTLAPDLCFCISYDQIFHRRVLESPPLGIVNFHAGKLPHYRGRNVINWAIINGEIELGITAHYVNEGIDTGDIILQRTVPIGWTDTYADVLARAESAIPEVALEALNLIAQGAVTATPQAGFGTYVGGREPGDEWLDWSDTSLHIYNKIRAITRPGPGARTVLGPEEVTIWAARYNPSWPQYIGIPGQVVGHDSSGAFVKTGDSYVMVTEAQIAGDLAGRPSWKIGTRLGIDLNREMLQRAAQATRAATR